MTADVPDRPPGAGRPTWSPDVLLAGTAAGDRRAFAELYRRLSPRVMRTVRTSVAARHTTDRVVVDVFVQIWRTAATFDPRNGTADSWVTAITREQIRRQVHRHHQQHHLEHH